MGQAGEAAERAEAMTRQQIVDRLRELALPMDLQIELHASEDRKVVTAEVYLGDKLIASKSRRARRAFPRLNKQNPSPTGHGCPGRATFSNEMKLVWLSRKEDEPNGTMQ
jgi:hypothetical protein